MTTALSRIRPEYREVVVLRYQEGLTHPEIAEILGIPSGTVKTYLHRARKELAGILSEQGWGPPNIRMGTSETIQRRFRNVNRDSDRDRNMTWTAHSSSAGWGKRRRTR